MLHFSPTRKADRFAMLRNFREWFSQKLKVWKFSREISRLYRKQQQPVLVYQMAKVGSRSVVQSFPTNKYSKAIHVHRLSPQGIDAKVAELRRLKLDVPAHYWQGKTTYENVIQRNLPFKMITTVREPIGRNLSFFFQKFERVVGMPVSESRYTVKELTEIFLANQDFLNRSSWFDNEFRVALGTNIYEHPFPRDLGYQKLTCRSGELLLLKIELDDSVIEKSIAEFLQDPSFKFAKANKTSSKKYGEKYRSFCRQVVLPASYVNQMIDSCYTQHFYTAEEINSMRAKWFRRLA